VKPIGYPSHVRLEKFTPTSFNSVSTSDLIRFNISSNGFWDPYTAYIKLEVDISTDTSGTVANNSTIFGLSVPKAGGRGVGS
jgi:predicted oxidoreductase (fatty acid repression mutant protein)